MSAEIDFRPSRSPLLLPIRGRTWSERNRHRNFYLVGAAFARSSSSGSLDCGLTCSLRFPSLDGPTNFWVVVDSSAGGWGPEPWSALLIYNAAMLRELVWIDQSRFRGWGCSQCAWIFNPQGPPNGPTFDAMLRDFEARRDKEFASHICANHARKPKIKPDTV